LLQNFSVRAEGYKRKYKYIYLIQVWEIVRQLFIKQGVKYTITHHFGKIMAHILSG
jgi:hypothetical protein